MSEAELLGIVDRLNADPGSTASWCSSRCRSTSTARRSSFRIDPAKDVDGFHPVNVGRLVMGDPKAFRPATPYGVQQMLVRSGIETKGAHAVIVGRSQHRRQADGEPADPEGSGGDATVTVCHSKTRDLPAVTRSRRHPDRGDRQGRVRDGGHGRAGAVVIDVGINRVDDADRAARVTASSATWRTARCAEIASAITPVPGGVGPMTIAMLLHNTLQAMAADRGAHAVTRDTRWPSPSGSA